MVSGFCVVAVNLRCCLSIGIALAFSSPLVLNLTRMLNLSCKTAQKYSVKFADEKRLSYSVWLSA